jgi:hypothetical protein
LPYSIEIEWDKPIPFRPSKDSIRYPPLANIKRTPGIYAFLDPGTKKPYYIGLSKNVHGRLKKHLGEGKAIFEKIPKKELLYLRCHLFLIGVNGQKREVRKRARNCPKVLELLETAIIGFASARESPLINISKMRSHSIRGYNNEWSRKWAPMRLAVPTR